MNKSVTVNDVAKAVGVSGRTVSRVVNGDSNVSEKVRAAVNKAILDLGYRPNLAARSLKTNKSFLIGLIMPNIDSAYYRAIQTYVGNACAEQGYHVVIEKVGPDEESALFQSRKFLGEVKLAGVILVLGTVNSPKIRALVKAQGYPYAAITTLDHLTDFPSVIANEEAGEIALANHLFSQGHKRYVVVTAPPDIQYSRGLAFESQLLGLGVSPEHIYKFEFDWHLPGLEAGRRVAVEIIDRGLKCTAMFASNDEMAAGAIGSFLSNGISIPEDISVVGFDDSAVAQATWPQLTTVRQPIDDMARQALSHIIQFAAEDMSVTTCPIELILRHSTAPPKSAII